ncbi:MAG: ABC transporter ATP-binding protein [Lachnospira sp.]|jgi:putative ABC transport system ATP-binding protein|nr:ABC transporter ATP-binding protein [Lachnospira sp.]
MNILEAVSISKTFTNGDLFLKALDNISLTVTEGEFIVIIGTSGSGKSTLLNILGGLEYPTHGYILVNGINITNLSEEQRTQFRLHHIGFVFQNYNLIPVINILENIILPAKLMGRTIDEIEVKKLVSKLGISDKLYYMPNALSGGQQQRAAIARALYTKPKLLLADEPTGNLDSKSGMETIHLMREMCDEYKQTMIVVTHDKKITQLADRVIQIEDGKVV